MDVSDIPIPASEVTTEPSPEESMLQSETTFSPEEAPVTSSEPATAPITVTALPIEHKEAFWEIAKQDLEAAISWLKTEIEKL